MNKKILLTGGGTAGHCTPNLALIPYLEKEGMEVVYIGTKNGIEREIITNAGIKYYPISAGKLRRYFSLKNFSDPFKIIAGYFQAKKIIKKDIESSSLNKLIQALPCFFKGRLCYRACGFCGKIKKGTRCAP